ncbi:hypothetical protein Cgig2_009238 [Carnegiea gigantea]|uniref:Uncharacterized protein n=1 Tax=Carnegiea gigantea TaxID=171969 RepID=A0A9Q1GKG5_9CARY|nr:hypothetical protein Cgig2_009238 [Carnegiea gigantea]
MPFWRCSSTNRPILEVGLGRLTIRRRARVRMMLYPPLVTTNSVRAVMPSLEVTSCIEIDQFREPKKIPYAVPIYKLDIPLWSGCEYSSTPSILSIEGDVVYPWEINVAISRMTDFQECRLAMSQASQQLKTPNQLMAEGSSEGNYSFSSHSHRTSEAAGITSTSSSTRGEEAAHPAHTRRLLVQGGPVLRKGRLPK